jgi:hypothetical protein
MVHNDSDNSIGIENLVIKKINANKNIDIANQ